MSPTIIEIVILSIVQGLTEPLPVSSSAHVIAIERLMHLDPSSPELTFLLAMLHTGTMAAVIIYFWGTWRRGLLSDMNHFKATVWRVGLATAATAVVYLGLEQVIKRTLLGGRPGAEVEELFGNLVLVAIALAVGGILILYSGLKSGRPGAGAPKGALTGVSAIWIGVAQGIVLPFRGLSRSGSTISTGLILGVPRALAEEFSFALAVVITPPAIARELLRVLKARATEPGIVHLGPLIGPGLLGVVFSFIAGLLALKWLSGWIERGRWHYFGIYCLVAAAGVLALRASGY